VEWNPAAVSIFGYSREEAIGQHWTFIVPNSVWPYLDGVWDSIVNQRGGNHSVNENITRDERIISCEWFNTPLIDSNGETIGVASLVMDNTERVRAETALQKFAFMANTAPEFMSLVNRQYVYESVNDAYCQARGKSQADFIGHSMVEIWGETLFQERLRPYLEQCFAGEVVRYEETFVFFGTDLRNYQVGMYPYQDPQGEQVTHVVVVTSDITEYKQTESALRQSALNLKKAQQFAHLGSWTWNIKTNHLEWSDEMYAIFDVDKETFTGSLPDVISEAIHPDDRAKVNASNLSVINEGKPVPLDYRIVRKDGSIRVVWAEAGELVKDETGQPSFLSGTVQDITERKQMEEELRASLAEKEALLKEVHHRVKNNLQIISSLLSMQASSSQNEQVIHALDESKDRVRAMALIHEKLYQSKNLEYIQAEEYISELIDQLVSSFAGQMRNISLDLQVADLTLDINQAIPCGMIINELVSNALKYAFPEQRSGLVRICLGSHEGNVRLVISDNGVGLPASVDVHHPETLGLELVSILSHQLKASLEVTRQPGTTFTITFNV
jgi:PAS domain S-box-containing protein